MKKLNWVLASIFVMTTVGASAQAQEIVRVAHIDINNCATAQQTIENLSKPGMQVQADCAYGDFWGSNGAYYPSRLTTTITFPNHVQAGTQVQLAVLDLNDCGYAQGLINNLSSANEPVQTECDYNSAGIPAGNGEVYPYRLTTTLTVY